MRHRLLTLGAAALLAGCIQGTPQQQQDPAEAAIARHVSKQAPAPEHALGVRFAQKVELLGYDVDPAEPEPGQTVELTWYWHVDRPLGEGWSLFTHLVDAASGEMCTGCNYDQSTVNRLRQVYPPGQWKAGDYIRDVQRIVLPEKMSFAEGEFRIGFYQGSKRLPVTKGPQDQENRAKGPRFPTGYQPPPVGELEIPQIAEPITVDGQLTEAAWRQAVKTKAFVNATDGEAARPRTKARLLYDAKLLYVAFECDDEHLFSTYRRRDDELWKQDAVEVFIDPPGTGRDYLEFQVGPQGLLFDTKIKRAPDRDDSWDGQAKAAATRRGTLNDDNDRDQGWTVELAIPLASLSQTPPTPGTQWRLNLFRLDTRLGGRRAFLAWSPPLENTTHVTNRFGKVTFGALRPSAPAGSEDAATGLDASHDTADEELDEAEEQQ